MARVWLGVTTEAPIRASGAEQSEVIRDAIARLADEGRAPLREREGIRQVLALDHRDFSVYRLAQKDWPEVEGDARYEEGPLSR